jgi:hypothetical protein
MVAHRSPVNTYPSAVTAPARHQALIAAKARILSASTLRLELA